MRLGELSELVWNYVQLGRPTPEGQNFHQADIAQMIKLSVANALREMYYASKQENRYNEPDYFFSSPLLDTKRFALTEPDMKGKRVADMSDFDLFRLPRNSHVPNIYPHSEKGCGNQEVGEITQVSPGEENFYINDPDLSGFQFFVIKGRRIQTYNIPSCITHLDVEATYDLNDDSDITMDIAYKSAMEVLAQSLKTNDATGNVQAELKEKLQKLEGIK